MEIKSTLESEHYKSTIVESSTPFTFKDSSGEVYLTSEGAVYDFIFSSGYSIDQYIYETDTYLIGLYIILYGDYAIYRVYKINKSTGYISVEIDNSGYYASSITLVKELNGHIYIGYYDSASFNSYTDYDVNAGTFTDYNKSYTGGGTDLNNIGIPFQGYSINSRNVSYSARGYYYVKFQFRLSEII